MGLVQQQVEKRTLPAGWRWTHLGDECVLNPSRPRILRDDRTSTTFVPMSAIDERKGEIIRPESRQYQEVKKGYTYFAERDVLFAKITPCMQNGKHAIAHRLLDGIGFGSTEFHIIRPGPNICSEWIHTFLRQPLVLADAEAHLTGAVGQQRLPEDYLRELELSLPPLPEQQRITGILNERMAAINKARAAAEAQIAAAKALQFSFVKESLLSTPLVPVRLGNSLAEVTCGIGSTWDQYSVLGATRDGLSLAKERPGRCPERYKPVIRGTIFYNPMRILIGSIAHVDDERTEGITSPDYVVFKTKDGILHHEWFYHWLRSPLGNELIRSLARGAVRERMLFGRLSKGEIRIPRWEVQVQAAERIVSVAPLLVRLGSQLIEINALPQSLSRQAFNGEI